MKRHLLALLLAASGAIAAAAATMPVIYPAKGQSPTQTDRDKLACYDWSRTQSGFDPLQPPATTASTAAAAPSANPNGSGMAGMVKGAAGGAAVAELTHGDAGKGAAIGVLGAGLRDRARQQQQQQSQQQQQQQQAQQQAARAQQQKATFDRAFGACMEGRGYVVK